MLEQYHLIDISLNDCYTKLNLETPSQICTALFIKLIL